MFTQKKTVLYSSHKEKRRVKYPPFFYAKTKNIISVSADL